MEELFLKAGLPADKAKQTLKNEDLSKLLSECLILIGKNVELTRDNGMQVYSLVTKYVKYYLLILLLFNIIYKFYYLILI